MQYTEKYARSFTPVGNTRRGMKAADRIAKGDRVYKKASDLAARNAYRKACGLPEVTQ